MQDNNKKCIIDKIFRIESIPSPKEELERSGSFFAQNIVIQLYYHTVKEVF